MGLADEKFDLKSSWTGVPNKVASMLTCIVRHLFSPESECMIFI